MFGIARAPGAIGLDIGSSAVRAVQVAGGRGPAGVERVGQVSLPPGAVRDGEIADADAVVAALRELWSRHGFQGRRVLLGVANQQVVVRQLDLPYLPEAELRQALPFQVADAIPIPIEQAILDFHLVEQVENEAGRVSRILLVAAQRGMVDAIVDAVRRAGLEPAGIDLAAFALLRSLAPRRTPGEDGGELLVDIGAAVTNIVVHDAGVPRFVRILLMGGNLITDSLMAALDLSHDAAEAYKATTGVADEYDFGLDDPGARLVTERASRFVEEIRGSLNYYSAQAHAVPVRRVVVTGGASLLPNLRERLADTLGLPVERGNPYGGMRVGAPAAQGDSTVSEPYLAVAIGLAMTAATAATAAVTPAAAAPVAAPVGAATAQGVTT